VDQVAAAYRAGLVESITLLILLLLAFGSITILARDRWLRLTNTESLLARLAAAIVLAAVAVGGLSGVLLNLLQGSAFADNGISPATSRSQAVLGIGLALALTIVGIIRIEMYHRRIVNPPAQEEDADWKVEPPEAAGGR
jgi:formate-dependent nitrite reductase membrane component NrfD